jgi:type IV secretory pathway VirB10-like protein
MDDTTRQDVMPPNFDTGGWQQPVATVDAPTRPSAGVFIHERPTRPTPVDSLVDPLARPAGALDVETASRAASGPRRSPDRPTGAQPTPSVERPTSVMSSAAPADGAGDATGMTYASKVPADAPGLQLEKPQARTLRKGPVLTSIAIIGGAVIVAVVVALTPRSESAKAGNPTRSDTSTKDITLPDNVREAPENNSELHPAPRLGPPGGKAQIPNGGETSAAREAARQAIRDERVKALASPILVELETPTSADQGANPVLAHLTSGPNPIAAGGPLPDSMPTPAASTGGSLSAGGVADPNMQQHKSDFLSRDGINNASYLSQSLAGPGSPYEVKAGTIIPTSLITGMNSDLPGQVVGQVRENVYDTVSGNYLLIPQGSRLLATYDSAVTFGQERVLVCWNRLIRPDGSSIPLECMPGVDLSGQAGFADQVDNHWWRIITGVALGTLVSATAQRSQGDVSGYNPTVPQLWAANAGGAVNQAGQAITQKNLAIQPTIKIRPGFSVNVIVTKDIVLAPYVSASP